MNQTSSPVRVAIVQRVVPGYRIPVFNAINNLDSVDLTVIHGTNPRGRPRGNTDFENKDIKFERRELATATAQPFGLHLVWLRGLLRSVREDEFDVYICPASPSILSVVALRILTRISGDAAVVWWGRSLGQKREVSTEGRLLRKATEYARAPLYQSGDACVCYGTAAAEFFQSYGVPESDIYIAFNSTDTEKMDRVRADTDDETLATVRKKYDAEDRLLLGFVGTHTPEKNIDVLVDTHARLLAQGYETSVVIAGDGPETEQLHEYAENIPHVHFTGRIPDEELGRLLLATDIFVMPGHGGLAVQQAMSLANPIVTTPLDGTEQDLIKEGENGYIVPERDRQALTEQVVELLDMTDAQRQEMGDHSRAIIDDHINIDRMAEGFRRAIDAAREAKTDD